MVLVLKSLFKMSLSVKESDQVDRFISSFTKRIIRKQNSDSHSAASTCFLEYTNSSWSPTPGPIDLGKEEIENRKVIDQMNI